MSKKLITILFTGLLVQANCSVEYPEKPDGSYESPNGAGVLEVTDGVKVLKLSGTNYEMGYAHGNLLAEEIVYFLEEFGFWFIKERNEDYEELVAAMSMVSWTEGYKQELEGMVAGIEDKLGSVEIKPPGSKKKNLDIYDLMVMNTGGDWACSSFSIWGDGTEDGGSMIARNLDYTVDPSDAFKLCQVIVSFDDGIHKRFAGVVWCGMVGAASTMNEDGVCMMTHDTNFYPTSDEEGIYPRGIVQRMVAENIGADNDPFDVEAMLDTTPVHTGNNYHVLFPAQGKGSDDAIAAVLEFDGDATRPDGRATLRSPSDNPNLPCDGNYDQRLEKTNCIICTNHYLERKTWIPEDGPNRYLHLKDSLVNMEGYMNLDMARNMADDVGHSGTSHTVIFEPDNMKLHIYLAEPDKGAFESRRLDYDFEDLF